MDSLGQKIKRARQVNGYTQSDLASLLKVSNNTISRWENNKNEPTSEDLIKLSKVLDVDFTSEELDENNNNRDMELEDIRLELASARMEKKRTVIVLIVVFVSIIILLVMGFIIFWISAQKIDPNSKEQPMKLVEYYEVEGGEE